jgi:hypothetical protein
MDDQCSTVGCVLHATANPYWNGKPVPILKRDARGYCPICFVQMFGEAEYLNAIDNVRSDEELGDE